MGYARGLTRVVAIAGILTLCIGGAAYASDGQSLILGQDNTATNTTSINASQATIDPPLAGSVGFWAQNDNIGLLGTTTGYDTTPTDELTGVAGIGSDQGGWFAGVDVGVVGSSAGDGAPGVLGKGDTGVEADGAITGLSARGDTAIQATGAVTFSTAGLATVPKGKSSVTLKPGVAIGSSSKVLVTAQSGGGTFLRVGRVFGSATTGKITLYLTTNAKSAVTLAYFVIS